MASKGKKARRDLLKAMGPLSTTQEREEIQRNQPIAWLKQVARFKVYDDHSIPEIPNPSNSMSLMDYIAPFVDISKDEPTYYTLSTMTDHGLSASGKLWIIRRKDDGMLLEHPDQ